MISADVLTDAHRANNRPACAQQPSSYNEAVTETTDLQNSEHTEAISFAAAEEKEASDAGSSAEGVAGEQGVNPDRGSSEFATPGVEANSGPDRSEHSAQTPNSRDYVALDLKPEVQAKEKSWMHGFISRCFSRNQQNTDGTQPLLGLRQDPDTALMNSSGEMRNHRTSLPPQLSTFDDFTRHLSSSPAPEELHFGRASCGPEVCTQKSMPMPLDGLIRDSVLGHGVHEEAQQRFKSTLPGDDDKNEKFDNSQRHISLCPHSAGARISTETERHQDEEQRARATSPDRPQRADSPVVSSLDSPIRENSELPPEQNYQEEHSCVSDEEATVVDRPSADSRSNIPVTPESPGLTDGSDRCSNFFNDSMPSFDILASPLRHLSESPLTPMVVVRKKRSEISSVPVQICGDGEERPADADWPELLLTTLEFQREQQKDGYWSSPQLAVGSAGPAVGVDCSTIDVVHSYERLRTPHCHHKPDATDEVIEESAKTMKVVATGEVGESQVIHDEHQEPHFLAKVLVQETGWDEQAPPRMVLSAVDEQGEGEVRTALEHADAHQTSSACGRLNSGVASNDENSSIDSMSESLADCRIISLSSAPQSPLACPLELKCQQEHELPLSTCKPTAESLEVFPNELIERPAENDAENVDEHDTSPWARSSLTGFSSPSRIAKVELLSGGTSPSARCQQSPVLTERGDELCGSTRSLSSAQHYHARAQSGPSKLYDSLLTPSDYEEVEVHSSGVETFAGQVQLGERSALSEDSVSEHGAVTETASWARGVPSRRMHLLRRNHRRGRKGSEVGAKEPTLCEFSSAVLSRGRAEPEASGDHSRIRGFSTRASTIDIGLSHGDSVKVRQLVEKHTQSDPDPVRKKQQAGAQWSEEDLSLSVLLSERESALLAQRDECYALIAELYWKLRFQNEDFQSAASALNKSMAHELSQYEERYNEMRQGLQRSRLEIAQAHAAVASLSEHADRQSASLKLQNAQLAAYHTDLEHARDVIMSQQTKIAEMDKSAAETLLVIKHDQELHKSMRQEISTLRKALEQADKVSAQLNRTLAKLRNDTNQEILMQKADAEERLKIETQANERRFIEQRKSISALRQKHLLEVETLKKRLELERQRVSKLQDLMHY